MSDSFQCPKCGASYARERRRIGKAVVCSCGHKFLVPPFVSDEPPASVRPHTAPPNVAPRGRTAPRPPRKQPSASSDSSAEVLPLADVIEPAAELPAGRWAEPVEPPQPEPLPEAEVVYPAAPYADVVPVADDLFSAGGAYGDPLGAGAYAAPLAAPPPATARPRKKSGRSAGDGQIGFSNWVAYIVMFLLLPAAGIFTLLGVIEFRRSGPAGRGAQRAATSAPAPAAWPSASAPSATSYPITILSATKKATSDDFSMEYEVGRQPLNAASQYIWVVSSPQGKIEFQMPTPSAQSRGQISGKPGQAGLGPPFTTYIEEQSGGARTRVSNQIDVVVRG
jgi:hypothetical protein